MLPKTLSESLSATEDAGGPPKKRAMATLFVNGRRVTEIELDADHASFPETFPQPWASAYAVFTFFEEKGGQWKAIKGAMLRGDIEALRRREGNAS